jgi:hypothetical protein
MSTKTKVAFGLYLLCVLVIAYHGVLYVTLSTPMPYHFQAFAGVGVDWDSLQPYLQRAILGNLHARGHVSLVTALSAVILLFMPFRQGQRWSRWAIPAICLTGLLPAVVKSFQVAAQTGASTPRGPGVLLLAILFLAFLLSGDVGKPKESGIETVGS